MIGFLSSDIPRIVMIILPFIFGGDHDYIILENNLGWNAYFFLLVISRVLLKYRGICYLKVFYFGERDKCFILEF